MRGASSGRAATGSRWLGAGLVFFAAAIPLAFGAQERDVEAADEPRVDLLYAPHGDARTGFFTPWSEDPKSLWKLLKWQLFSRNAYDKSREASVPSVDNDGAYLDGSEPGASFTWVGHATFAIHDGEDVILTDPHWGERALIPRRLLPPGIPLEAIPSDAFAVVSHNHYDHLDVDTVQALPDTLQWFVPLGMAEWFRERGRTEVVELDWWQSASRGRWTVTCLPSQHWSQRIEVGANRQLWCAWLLDSGERRYFFAGDTGYFHGFREFGRRFGPIDVAMLPIGAYAPRWFMKWQHLNEEEALLASRDLRARSMLGMHWGTFDLTDEPLDLPAARLAELVAESGEDPARFRTLAVGERWPLPTPAAGDAE